MCSGVLQYLQTRMVQGLVTIRLFSDVVLNRLKFAKILGSN
jgi:hypothetical protein